MIPKTTRLGYEPCLKHAAHHWLLLEKDHWEQRYLTPYNCPPNNPRYWGTYHIERFRDWLWKEQALLVQINKQYYLEFTNPQQATLFALKWSQSRD